MLPRKCTCPTPGIFDAHVNLFSQPGYFQGESPRCLHHDEVARTDGLTHCIGPVRWFLSFSVGEDDTVAIVHEQLCVCAHVCTCVGDVCACRCETKKNMSLHACVRLHRQKNIDQAQTLHKSQLRYLVVSVRISDKCKCTRHFNSAHITLHSCTPFEYSMPALISLTRTAIAGV